MSHSFELAISTSINANIVEQIIKDMVESRTGKKIESISVRYDGTKFDGYDVCFESELATQAKKENKLFDKSWKPFIWE